MVKILNNDDCISVEMRKQLDSLGSNGALIWSLKTDQIEYIKSNYHYCIRPHIFKIKTSRRSSANLPSIIKSLVEGAQKGKPFLYTSLKKQEMEILDAYEIQYIPYKYLISSTAPKHA